MPAPPSLPAACAECLETTLLSIAGAIPTQIAMQQFRSLDGRIRINFGTTSIIINPLTGVRILLNHLAMEAQIITSLMGIGGAVPLPPAVGLAMGLAGAAILKVEQLGLALIEGHEVEGMMYVFPPGGLIQSWEVWTSVKLSLPVLTRTIGTFGVRTCLCQCTAMQPSPAMFEIPAGYTVIPPPAPTPPAVSISV